MKINFKVGQKISIQENSSLEVTYTITNIEPILNGVYVTLDNDVRIFIPKCGGKNR